MTSEMLDEIGIALYGVGYRDNLACALGVAKNTVRNWERGTSRIPPGVQYDLLVLCHMREVALVSIRHKLQRILACQT
jgi:hypothetical protein